MINIPITKSNNISTDIEHKLEQLLDKMENYVEQGVLIAFSGGVDSAFLIWAARKAMDRKPGGKVIALTTNSASMPVQDKADAEKITAKMKIKHIWRESREMDNPEYVNNDEMRCYHCKSELFSIAKQETANLGLKWIMYGYNASDVSDVRPGHQAAVENDVLHPLADIGFSKDDIRAILKRESIEIAEKAASPCLSSRISHGISVSSGKLADIAAMESVLHAEGIKICRVRINKTGDELFLRIEIHPDEFQKVLNITAKLNDEGKKRGYKWITMDMAGYRTGGGTE